METAAPLLRTEFNFTLPRGYVDARGNLHRSGVMRLATALDEIDPLRDPRVQSNPGYLTVIVLSRVVSRLGDITPLSPPIVEQLFSADFAYLQDLYLRINDMSDTLVETACPSCGHRFALDIRADNDDDRQ